MKMNDESGVIRDFRVFDNPETPEFYWLFIICSYGNVWV